jgi:hypothetical protein
MYKWIVQDPIIPLTLGFIPLSFFKSEYDLEWQLKKVNVDTINKQFL